MPHLADGLGYSDKVEKVKPSGIRIFDNQVSKIPGIIKLTLGEPDMNTPEHVKQAAIRSIQNNDSHYAPQKGKLALRKAISNFLDKTIHVKYDPETEVVVTVGATEAINAALFAISNPGDQVIIPTPVFSLYWPVATLADANFVLVNTAKDGFVLTPEHLEKVIEENPKAKAVILNYPTNPTGVEYSEENIKALAKVIRKHNLYVMTDEIYSTLTYGVKHYSIASEIPERAIYISGVSKSHAMTGYRLGYVAGPAEIMAQIGKVHGLMVTTTTDSSQAAALEALTNGLDDPEGYRKVYQERRDFVVKALNDMGMETVKPQGAFYVFAKIPEKFGKDDMKFALDLANKEKVGITPGSAFGPGGEGYVRLSYASSDENLHTTLSRIKDYLQKNGN